MKRSSKGITWFQNQLHKRDDRGSAIVIVIIAMALIGILATTILWASYLNYRIKINDRKVKNSFYSAETVVEQIMAGVKQEIVSVSINEAYQEVISNWDALGTDSNRESYFVTAYIEAVEEALHVSYDSSSGKYRYDKKILADYTGSNTDKKAGNSAYGYVDQELWNEDNAAGHINKEVWDNAFPEFKRAEDGGSYSSMALRNICIEFVDGNGYLSIINTDIAIDVPKLHFTQAGTIDRLYPYVLIGGTGIKSENASAVIINGSIYGGAGASEDEGGIRIGDASQVTINDASYVISGGDIVAGSSPDNYRTKQGANLIIRDRNEEGKGFRTNIYAQGLAVNGSDMNLNGRMYIANDLILSGKGSYVTLAGHYYGYGGTNESTRSDTVEKKDEDGKTVLDESGNAVTEEQIVNPADTSSAIIINGKDSGVDLIGLNTLLLAGRAYVSLPQESETDNGLPHILMGESISVKSNQIAYLVPPECVGTLDGKTVIGQNPVSFDTWTEMLGKLSVYRDNGQDFRIVDASREAVKLGNKKLASYGISDITIDSLGGIDITDSAQVITALNQAASSSGVRTLYNAQKQQVYLYLVMDKQYAQEYFAQYYNVNSNKVSLDHYFNQYVSRGIKISDDVTGYTVVGNSMVSVTDADGEIRTAEDGESLVRLLSSVEQDPADDGGTDEDGGEEGDYQEISDNVENIVSEKDQEAIDKVIDNSEEIYGNLKANLLEGDAGTEDALFENLIRLHTDDVDTNDRIGLQDYLNEKGGSDGKVEFTAGNGLKAVLVDCKKSGGAYTVKDSDLRLVVAIGDVEVKKDFQGLIIASGTITIADSVTISKDGAGVYDVLQAESEIEGDNNVPANIFYNGSGMIGNGYEEADVDESGNLNIDYSRIVRYENWIKK